MDSNVEIIAHLCHKIFIGRSDGKKLLHLMKDFHMALPTFPADLKVQERHGGALGWAAFRAGQLDFLLRLEQMAREYDQKVIAESKALDKDKS